MKPRYLLIAALLVLLYGIYGYHQNGQSAAKLATQITTQDNANQSITAPLDQLEAYVHNHLGATTSVFLAGSYNRAVAATKLSATPPVDGSVYADAQAACAGHSSSVVQAQCVTSYVTARLQAQPATAPAVAPAKASYTYRFAAPRWTADAVGLAFLLALLLAAGAGLLTLLRRSGRGR